MLHSVCSKHSEVLWKLFMESCTYVINYNKYKLIFA